MKVVILGAKGMLGRELVSIFQDMESLLLDRDDVDLRDSEELSRKIVGYNPDIIINAAAYTDVDGAEKNRELARDVNGYAVGRLARIASRAKIMFCHFSTDYVFNGANPAGYSEDDIPQDPVNAYGESKLLGETLMLETKGFSYFLIRTSWLFGKHGKNFVDTIFRLALTNPEIKVVSDQFGKPTYARDLAIKTREIIEKGVSGVYHVTNSVPKSGISWYDFASKIVEFRGFKTTIIPCNSDESPRPARRPRYSILQNTKLIPLQTWEEALEKYLHDSLR